MTWNDHDHRGLYADDPHDHGLDYAEKHHRHYDDESTARGLREDLGRAEARIRELEEDRDTIRRQLGGVLAQIRILDRLRPACVLCHDATADRQTVRGPACTDCVGDLPDGGPDPERPETWAFPGPEESGPGHEAAEPEHGPAAMRRVMAEHPLSPGGYVQQPARCAETSDGEHSGDWQREIWAFGLEAEPDPQPGDHDPGPEAGGEDQDAGPARAAGPAELNPPRQVSRAWWPDARCELVDREMCGAPAIARLTSRATGDHLWCCGPHAGHMLSADPVDAYVSWAKPGDPAARALLAQAPAKADVAAAAEAEPAAACECNGAPPCGCPDCGHPDCVYRDAGVPEPEPGEYDPGPEIDDEGGMSEYRYLLPEDYERGQS